MPSTSIDPGVRPHTPAPDAPAAEHKRIRFRPDIEGLRGVAVALVVAFHAGIPGVQGGFVGVDVFFVLSGYLITALLVAEIDRTGGVKLGEFYARRVRRLLPASALVLVTTILAGMLVYSPVEALRLARTAVATAAYSSNILFMVSLDYFAPAAERNPLLHTWSLAVEEQFYLVWPLLILAAGRASRARLTTTLGVLSALSLAGCILLTLSKPGWAFYATPVRAWEFGIGGLACLLPAALVTQTRARMLAWLGAAGVLGAAQLFTNRTLFPGPFALVPALGTAALLVACAAHPSLAVARVLNTPVLQFLGRLSYSWYLWHWPVLVLAAAVIPGITLPQRILAALLSLLLALATYTWLERPVRENKYLAARRRLSLAGGAGLTVMGLAVASLWYVTTVRQRSSPEHARFVAAAKDRAPLYTRGCMTMVTEDPRVRECVLGDTTAATTVVLFGDSHAAQWSPALDRAAAERGWKLVAVLKSGCPAPEVPIQALHGDAPACAEWRRAALRRIAELRPAVVVQASWNGYVLGSTAPGGLPRLTPERWTRGVHSTLQALTSTGTPVLLVRDPPTPGVDVPACLSRGDDCTGERARVLHTAAFQAEVAAARGLPVTTLDLTDRFCGPAACPAMLEDGTIVYSDDHHVTATYAARMAPAFGEAVARLIRPAAAPATTPG